MRKEDLENFLDELPTVGIVLTYEYGDPLYVAFEAVYLSGSLWFTWSSWFPGCCTSTPGPSSGRSIQSARSCTDPAFSVGPRTSPCKAAKKDRWRANAKCLSAGLKCGIHPYMSPIGSFYSALSAWQRISSARLSFWCSTSYITDPRSDKSENTTRSGAEMAGGTRKGIRVYLDVSATPSIPSSTSMTSTKHSP